MENKCELFKKKVLKKINQKPSSIGIELTTYCPLNCEYCVRKSLEKKDQEMSFEDFKLLVPKLKDFKRIVLCGMGEPTVYSHLYEAIELLKDKRITIITSGTVPLDYVRLNANRNIEVIVFSVDCPTEQEVIEMTGNYNWEHLMHNLSKGRGIAKIFNCTVTKYNYKHIPELVDLAVKNRLCGISFVLELIREDGEVDHEEIKRYIEEGEKRAKKAMLVTSHSYSNLKCISFGSVVPFIDIYGNIHPCCTGVERMMTVGNLFEKTFDEIWEDTAYGAYKSGHLCTTGCSMYNDKLVGLGGE